LNVGELDSIVVDRLDDDTVGDDCKSSKTLNANDSVYALAA